MTEICQKYGISDAIFYAWKEKYVAKTSDGTKRLRIWRMRAVGLNAL